MSRESLGWLLGLAVSEDPASREEAAEVVGDWETSLTEFDKRLLVRLLALMASTEGAGKVREAQLHAITDIFEAQYMKSDDVAPLFEIPVQTFDAQDMEYIDEIIRLLGEQR